MTGSPVSARDAYPHFQPITTRWKDNDLYGHVNNVEYYSYFDSVINAYLIRAGGLDIHAGAVIGVSGFWLLTLRARNWRAAIDGVAASSELQLATS